MINPVFIVDDIPPTIVCPGTSCLIVQKVHCLHIQVQLLPLTLMDLHRRFLILTLRWTPRPESYIINRTWLTTYGCTNTAFCLQVINVDEIAPQIENCAVTRNVEGCSTSAITGPNFSNTSAASSIAVFEDATNQGSISTICGTGTITYIDVATGTCPIVVTRTWSVTDLCGNTVSCAQTINVDDSLAPVVSGAITPTTVEGCEVGSAPAAVATVSALESLPGNLQIADGCTTDGALMFTSSQSSTGTCPIVITRIYTVTDACNNTSVNVVHTINVDDNTAPAVSGSVATTAVEGCSVSSAPAAVTTVAALESLPKPSDNNNGAVYSRC